MLDSTSLEDVFVHQYDGLKGRPLFVGELLERLFLAPALLREGVAGDAGCALEAGVEPHGDVGAWLSTATA